MIGDVVRVQISPGDKGAVSTRLRDSVMEHWRERAVVSRATLVPQDEEWREFWLYASGTSRWCPRCCAFQAMLPDGVTIEKENKSETLWNFGQGHAYHWLYQNKLLPALPLLGTWRNRDGRVVPAKGDAGVLELPEGVDVTWGAFPRPDGMGWSYEEIKLRHREKRIVVKIDGVIAWADGLEVFELKTEKETARDLLDPVMGGGPRAAHVEQVMLVMFLTGIRKARIVYVFKGAMTFAGSTIEHVISYDEALASQLLNMAGKCVDAVRETEGRWVDGVCQFADGEFDKLFPRLSECPMKSKGKARNCDMRDFCFTKRGKP